MKIINIELKKVFDSKGQETVQSTIITDKIQATASSPSGVSAGKHEKQHLIENAEKTIEISKPVIQKIIGHDVDQQKEIDIILKEVPGAVSISTSIAVAMAAAKENNVELYQQLNPNSKKQMPTLLNLIFAGGSHAKGKGPEFQEFLAIQENTTLEEQIEKNKNIHKQAAEKFSLTEQDYEKGWISPFSNEQTIEKLKSFGCGIGIDAAASEFFKEGVYKYKTSEKTNQEQVDYVCDLINKYNIKYFEDPLDEEDFEGFAQVLSKTKDCLVVGDDLTTSNKDRLQKAIDMKAINAIIIKPNQIGTLSEMKETIDLAKKNNIICITSHRAGETNDVYLSHITVAYDIPYMKISIQGDERICKLKELQKLKK